MFDQYMLSAEYVVVVVVPTVWLQLHIALKLVSVDVVHAAPNNVLSINNGPDGGAVLQPLRMTLVSCNLVERLMVESAIESYKMQPTLCAQRTQNAHISTLKMK